MPRKTRPRQQPKWLLSIDPAEAAGFAWFCDGKPFSYGPADGSKWLTLHAAISAVAPVMLPDESRECTIEDGYFQYGKQTFKGTLTLGRRRGLAQAAGEAMGITKFTFIGPSTWQNALGWTRGQNTKEWSKAYVKQRWGIEAENGDVSDALALGTFYLDSFLIIA